MKQKNLYIFFLLFFIVTEQVSFSQDLIFSNYFSNGLYYNPAYVGLLQNPELSVTYRNQWPGLSASFVTYAASYAQPLEVLHGGLGVYINNDVQQKGIISNTMISGMYSYYVNLTPVIRVSSGLQASYYFKTLSTSGLVFESDIQNNMGIPGQNETIQGYTKSFPDFSLGFIAEIDKKYSFGLAVHHLLQPEVSSESVIADKLARKYTVSAQARFDLKSSGFENSTSIQPGIIFQQQQSFQQLSYGVTYIMKPISMGVWLRQDLNFNYDACIISIGYLHTNFNFVYSYDVNLSGGRFFFTKMGAHEVTFLLNLEYKSKRKKIRAIKCPKI
ncbi:MAG: PorP/SprF family type IX secretion system membrane protein [Bacteroidales bacterium]|nr:PorP/SprF family type IX secretion system membrane protein [Bacteroidales bacterium]